MEVVKLTEAACNKARRLLDAEIAGNPEAVRAGLSVGVIGGGCSGLQYSLNFRNPTDEDFVYLCENGLPILVDPKSAVLLQGATIDFHDELGRSGFEVINPNATNGCGCGKSFGA